MTVDIQAELQQYLKEKDLNSLFVSLVEALLIERPDNPIEYMVNYLKIKFPLETKDACLNYVCKYPVPEMTDTNEDSDMSSSDSDIDESTIQDRAPTSKRRMSVCAEKICEEKLDTELRQYPKSDIEAARIRQMLQKIIFFRDLDEDQQKIVQDAMFLVETANGDVIIKQGDVGDNFYIIDKGMVDVYLKSNGEEMNLVASYSDGDSFGELAIMYNSPRAATCVSNGPVRLWVLDRLSFKLIVTKTTTMKRNHYKSFLEGIPTLSSLTEYEVLTIADALQEETYQSEEIVCREGDYGDRFFIIKEGTAVCTKICDGFPEQVAILSTGSYFGEVALMTSKVRQATVTASSLLKCLTLDRKTFKRVLGPLQDILMRNMTQYSI